MFCENCGNEISGKKEYCPECGHKLDNSEYIYSQESRNKKIEKIL